MLNNVKRSSWWNTFWWWSKEFISRNKIVLIIYGIIILFGVLTGIFTAFKYDKYGVLIFDYGIDNFCDGKIFDFAAFLKRTLSIIIVCLLLFIFSLTKWTLPLGAILILYRAYLVGLNCALMFTVFGLGVWLVTVLVIFPSLILLTLLMTLLFIILCDKRKIVSRYGKSCNYINSFSIVLIFFALMLLIVIVQSVLLWVFDANIILVI